mgnify:CR=1 FL=1
MIELQRHLRIGPLTAPEEATGEEATGEEPVGEELGPPAPLDSGAASPASCLNPD